MSTFRNFCSGEVFSCHEIGKFEKAQFTNNGVGSGIRIRPDPDPEPCLAVFPCKWKAFLNFLIDFFVVPSNSRLLGMSVPVGHDYLRNGGHCNPSVLHISHEGIQKILDF